MSELISEQQFLLRQPSFPQTTPTDPYYYRVACRLARVIADENLLPGWPAALAGRVAIGLTGYLQDLLTDSGIWRAFTEEHYRLYGRRLPFYEVGEDYILHELNEEDVRFIVWYTLVMGDETRRVWNPLDRDIAHASHRLHEILNEVYEDDDAPIPEDYHISRGLELGNPEEADEVFHFGNWLFMHCWLMTPAFAMTLGEIVAEPEMKGGENLELLKQRLEEAMMELPTGPLALYLREWLFLIIEGKMPPEPKHKLADAPANADGDFDGEDSESSKPTEHPYYTKFMAATGGTPIKFFRTYEDLNRFFIDALGWEEGDNLPALKGSSDFVLLVNREKGMLCARNVARCIRMEGNPCYDPAYAREHAIDLLTVRGLCPGDLLQYLFSHDAIPDARFPGTQDTRLTAENRDFIARLYLQQYYRGD